MSDKDYELIIVGGGSGGVGAAISAGRAGVHTLLIEPFEMLGGTSTVGGVNCWEMGIGGTGIPFEIFQRLKKKSRSGWDLHPGTTLFRTTGRLVLAPYTRQMHLSGR